MPVDPKFPNGLKLIDINYVEINSDKESGQGSMVVPVEVQVPYGTKGVHLGVTAMNILFGSHDNPTHGSFREMGYEIIQRDNSSLDRGLLRFEFRAILKGDEEQAPWSGYFVLEVMCFG